MKLVLIFITSILIIVGCNQQSTIQEPIEILEIEEIITEAKEVEVNKEPENSVEVLDEKITEHQRVLSIFYQTVYNKIANFGILTEDNIDEMGLAYVDLLDFDQDGLMELYVMYKKSEDYYNSSFYVEEIWMYDGGEGKKIHSKEFSNGGLVSDASRSIVLSDGSLYLIEAGGYSAGRRGSNPDANEYGSWIHFYNVKDNQLNEVMLPSTLFQVLIFTLLRLKI
ncbi:hypothetical protein AWH56_005855 [Anaerobacillus isosaccharinicus]|uniref:Uncharacterized protein n=1 Tax=Anaerobacillus isosaccharinicus TaxID=1532552 RepID=A0A1S2LS49_9BACI|nr:hypothetical protein [Anaerobacillus isosaccharinicus]MBA5584451.1 hypothetical protein [Anaerobacillus isosaccharinicus]QOY37162.1 hypothetical protein AWH56_005855 [Anaerobacillus isosaccharinicus]